MKTKVVQYVPRINISMSQTQTQSQSQSWSQTQTKTHRFPAFVMLTFFIHHSLINIQRFLFFIASFATYIGIYHFSLEIENKYSAPDKGNVKCF